MENGFLGFVVMIPGSCCSTYFLAQSIKSHQYQLSETETNSPLTIQVIVAVPDLEQKQAWELRFGKRYPHSGKACRSFMRAFGAVFQIKRQLL